jgi:hypothetical protein
VSNKIMSQCWPLKMPPTAKAILISLADHAGEDGLCWPSIDTVSDRTCVSRRSVIDAIKWLEDSCALVADRSNGRHTKYRLTPLNFLASNKMSMRSENRQTSANAASLPVQMPHRFEVETSADAARVGVQMTHGFSTSTSAALADTSAALADDQCGIGRKPVQMPHSNHHEPSLNHQGTTNARREIDVIALAGFPVFYAAYPRKVNKPAAWKAWQKLKPDEATQALILTAVAFQRKTADWTKDDKKYVPHPATYLNGRMWEDEIPGLPKSVGLVDWVKAAGFTHIAEAQNVRCHIGNYREFRDGKRIAQEVHA